MTQICGERSSFSCHTQFLSHGLIYLFSCHRLVQTLTSRQGLVTDHKRRTSHSVEAREVLKYWGKLLMEESRQLKVKSANEQEQVWLLTTVAAHNGC